MIKYLHTFIWFLKRPRYIPYIKSVINRNMNSALENSAIEATLWCKTNAVSKEAALRTTLGGEHRLRAPRKEFPEVYQFADSQEKECPYEMGGEGACDLIFSLASGIKAQNILETGVAYGWSSLALLLAIKGTIGSKLISNDMPYVKMENDKWVGCVVPKEFHEYWDLQRLPDITGIPLAISKMIEGLDLIHYDSDKSYHGRTWSAPILWEALIPGGLFISDDINDNIAFKEFCELQEVAPIICEHNGKYVGIARKSK